MEIPKAQLENLEVWQSHPMTQWFFEQIDRERREAQEYLGKGGTVDIESADTTAMQTAKHYGYVSGLDFCTEFEIIGGEEDES